jgi:predicted dehydrogenase
MYTDYRDMLGHAGLDLVVISTPNWLHCEMACAFLESGKHVFVEKPMGINRAECDRVLNAARKSGKNLAIDFEMRVSPFASRLKRLLDSREVGELRRIEMIHHRGGWLETGNGIWRTRPEKSGGLFLMEPIHTVDIFRHFAGEVKAVQSTAGPNVLGNYRFPDNVCSHLFFESGVLGTILTTHTLSAQTDEANRWGELGHDMNMIFTCTKGSVAVDFLRARFLINRYEQFPAGSTGTRVLFDHHEDYSAGGGWHAFFHDISAMRREFIRRCAHDEPPVQDPADAWKTHLVCLAAEESAKSDFRRIDLDYRCAV